MYRNRYYTVVWRIFWFQLQHSHNWFQTFNFSMQFLPFIFTSILKFQQFLERHRSTSNTYQNKLYWVHTHSRTESSRLCSADPTDKYVSFLASLIMLNPEKSLSVCLWNYLQWDSWKCLKTNKIWTKEAHQCSNETKCNYAHTLCLSHRSH